MLLVSCGVHDASISETLQLRADLPFGRAESSHESTRNVALDYGAGVQVSGGRF